MISIIKLNDNAWNEYMHMGVCMEILKKKTQTPKLRIQYNAKVS